MRFFLPAAVGLSALCLSGCLRLDYHPRKSALAPEAVAPTVPLAENQEGTAAEAEERPSLWRRADRRAAKVCSRLADLRSQTLNRVENAMDASWTYCITTPIGVAGYFCQGWHP